MATRYCTGSGPASVRPFHIRPLTPRAGQSGDPLRRPGRRPMRSRLIALARSQVAGLRSGAVLGQDGAQ